jgi:phosphoglycolate phosphatase-like HAD superfamily hydrolase
LNHYLAITGIEALVDAVACGSDGKAGKPAPDLVSLALKRLRAGVRSAVLVGDTPYDAQAAHKAGIRSVGVLTGHFSQSVLCEAGCDAVLHDVVRLGDAVEAAAVQPSRGPKVPQTVGRGRTGARRPVHSGATRTSAITGR